MTGHVQIHSSNYAAKVKTVLTFALLLFLSEHPFEAVQTFAHQIELFAHEIHS